MGLCIIHTHPSNNFTHQEFDFLLPSIVMPTSQTDPLGQQGTVAKCLRVAGQRKSYSESNDSGFDLRGYQNQNPLWKCSITEVIERVFLLSNFTESWCSTIRPQRWTWALVNHSASCYPAAIFLVGSYFFSLVGVVHASFWLCIINSALFLVFSLFRCLSSMRNSMKSLWV